MRRASQCWLACIACTAGLVSTGPANASWSAPAAGPGNHPDWLFDTAPPGQFGDTLVAPTYSPPATINPFAASDDVSLRVVSYLYESLIDENCATYALQPALAKSWQRSADGKTYTFELRRGLTWSDGQPITADDVVFTFGTAAAQLQHRWEGAAGLYVWGKLPRVVRRGSYTVSFELPEPHPAFLRGGIAGVPVVPRHVFKAWLGGNIANARSFYDGPCPLRADPSKAVISGPWKVAHFDAGEHMVFSRNPLCFRVNHEGKRLPYFDRMVMPFYGTADNAIEAFRRGESDAQWIPSQLVSGMRDDEGDGHYHLVDDGPDFRTTYLAFNLNPGVDKDHKPFVDPVKLAWFADRRFRQAVSCAIDRQAIIDEDYRGLASRQDSPVSGRSPFYRAATFAGARDTARAATLLAAAGFRKKGDRLADAGGHPVIVTALQLGPTTREVVARNRRIQANLADIGIELRVREVSWEDLRSREFQTCDWECLFGDWGTGIEPEGLADVWTSYGRRHFFDFRPDAAPGSAPPYAWEASIDRCFETGARTVDEVARKRLFTRFQEIVDQEQVLVYLPVFHYTFAVRDSLGNARPSAYSTVGFTWNSYELFRK